MKDYLQSIAKMKDYLQPIATLFVAIGLAFIAVDQYRTSNARFNCAQAFGNSEGSDKDLSRLGLPKDGNYNNIRGYCRAFISPENSSNGGYSSIDFPSSIDVSITDLPGVSIDGDVGIRGGVEVSGMVFTD